MRPSRHSAALCFVPSLPHTASPPPRRPCCPQVTEVAARLHHACTEHYLAYMGLLSDVSARASVVLRALWQ